MSIKKDITWRVGLIYVVLSLFALLIASKLVFLQFINDAQWKKIAKEERVKNFRLPSHRGDILASDGRLLASSIPYYEVRMDMKAPAVTNKIFNEHIDSLAICLSDLFKDRTSQMYKRELVNARKRGERYYPIATKVNYLQLKKLKKFPLFRRGRFKGGVIYISRTERARPNNELARRVIGYETVSKTDRDVGLEGAFNEFLKGREGFQKMQKLSGGVWMPIDGDDEVEPEEGGNIITTIDVDLQDVAHRALLKQLQIQQAQYGSVIVMDVSTGDVLSMVNLSRVGNSYGEVYNYAVGASTEPGSTFKLPALITALEHGYVNLTDTIDTGNGKFQPHPNDKFLVKDDNWRRGGYGKLTVQQVFEKSSNVGMAKIITSAYRGREHQFVDRLYQMSLNEPLGLKIPGEGRPQINYPGDPLWSGVSIAQMAYGYEVRLTPLQLLTFYNAIANNGVMVKPRFVKEVRKHGKIVRTFPPKIINQSICSKSTIKKAVKMMEGVVEHGTATNLSISQFKIAGKTGTTQIYNKVGGYKGKKSYQASFAGFFPAENPQYSCIVVISAPSQNVYHGNRVAGPVFLEIANKVYASNISLQKPLNVGENSTGTEIPYSKNGFTQETEKVLSSLGIKTVLSKELGEWAVTQKQEDHILLENKRLDGAVMPDVVAMGLKDALFMLENMGLKVKVDGRGSIKKQSIPPGTKIKKGQEVTLEMSFIGG